MFNNGNNKVLQSVIDAASKILMGVQDQSVADAQTESSHPIAQAQMAEAKMKMKEKMDPVGKEDDDVDNDGDEDQSDKYLKTRRKAIAKNVKEADDLDTPAVDKALQHDCATHVVHEFYGNGECIPGMHTIEESVDGEAYVTHYDVMFQDETGAPYILEDVAVEDLGIVAEMSHGHSRKKKKM